VKIIAFSLWGDNPKYCVGAIRNAELAQRLFPEWTCRFYIGTSVPMEIVHKLAAMSNTHIVRMDSAGDWRGMFWRFQAASDPDCEAMISRDCDSRLGLRERAAVEEWLASPKAWHIMRDHPWHGSTMLGGMWGVKGCAAMADWVASWQQEDRYQTDQDFLRTMIYPIARHNAMIHASFCAIEPDAIPFPSSRNGYEFVGQVFDEYNVTVAEHQTMLQRAMKGQGELVRADQLPPELQDLL